MEGLDEHLKANIRSILCSISDDAVNGIIQAIKYAGVESFSDLEFVQEEDLTMVLKPVQRRKLIRAWSKPDMRYAAAYRLAALGGNKNPSVADIKKILEGVGIEADQERVKKVITELNSKIKKESVASAKPTSDPRLCQPSAPDTVTRSTSPLPESQNSISSSNSKPSSASLSSANAPVTVSNSSSSSRELQSNHSSSNSKPSRTPLLPLPDASGTVSRSRSHSPSPDLQSNHSSISSKPSRTPLLPLPNASSTVSRSRSPSPELQSSHSSLNSKPSRTPLLPRPESQNSHSSLKNMPLRGPLLPFPDPRCPSPPLELQNSHSSLSYASPRHSLLPHPDVPAFAADDLLPPSPPPASLRSHYDYVHDYDYDYDEPSTNFHPPPLLPLPSLAPAAFPPAKSPSEKISAKRKRDEMMQA